MPPTKYPLALGSIVYHTLLTNGDEVSICLNHVKSLSPVLRHPARRHIDERR